MSIELNPIANPEKIGGFNTNFQLIEDELNENVLRRQGLSPGEANHMEVSFDMNSNSILNVSTDTSDPGSLLSLGDADTRFVFVSGDTSKVLRPDHQVLFSSRCLLIRRWEQMGSRYGGTGLIG